MQPERGTLSSLVVAGVALIACCYGLARFAYGLFAPDFARDFALTPALSGLIGSGGYVGYCVAIVASTVATPRLGARRVAVAAGVLATAGIATVAAAPNATVLAIGILVAGSSTGVASPPLAAAVAAAIRERSRDAAQTIVNAGTGIGVLVSGPVAVLLADDWRVAWTIFAVVAAGVTVWAAFAVPDARPEAGGSTASPVRPSRPLALLVAAAATMGVGSIGVWTFGRQAVLDAGAADWVAPAVWTAIGAAGVLGAFAGALIARIGIRWSWALGMVAMAAGGAALALLAASPVAALAAGAVFGAAYIALTGVLLVWSTRLVPGRAAFGVGLAFLAIAVGQAIGAPLVGVVAAAVPLAAVLVGCAAIAAIGALLAPRRVPAP